MSSQFFFISAMDIREFSYFCADVTFAFFYLHNLLRCQRRIRLQTGGDYKYFTDPG
jgi:hypothetical protein